MEKLGVEMHHAPSKNEFAAVYKLLDIYNPDLIVMGGFLKQLPAGIVKYFYTVNIHPAVLPWMYKGSYHTYEQAFNNEDIYVGITVHKAEPEYDVGQNLSQIIFERPRGDLDMLKAVGLQHEYAIFFKTIASLLESGNKPDLMKLDMTAVATHAQRNLKEKGLPEVRTFIPDKGDLWFKNFDPKQSSWTKNALRYGR
jgi:folate-dependent phosphoribosylglycinamide formyltransferase PurN